MTAEPSAAAYLQLFFGGQPHTFITGYTKKVYAQTQPNITKLHLTGPAQVRLRREDDKFTEGEITVHIIYDEDNTNRKGHPRADDMVPFRLTFRAAKPTFPGLHGFYTERNWNPVVRMAIAKDVQRAQDILSNSKDLTPEQRRKLKEAQKAMEKMTPEQRRMLEAMMGEGGLPLP